MSFVFIPSLVSLLMSHEEKLGRELTRSEVQAIRDNATVISVPVDVAKGIVKDRGYRDLDPENAWTEWQNFRRDN
ncbi:hypothetical protein PLGE761_02355 [Pluralibacter gergoviae]|uniref:hypothetical protein n=1 Tax=Pluralibacter gergoviae TaxID=61647 RepID=UPI0007DAB617|nr:hypothetical protein [Pluralibacter gergoviae]